MSGGGFHANFLSFAARKCSFVSNVATVGGGGGVLSSNQDGALAVVEDVVCDMNEAATGGQGLTLVHFSAQPKPFLTKNTP